MKNYIILGIIQGILEWIPISSEGVVGLWSQFFLRKFNPLDIALFLHAGTLFVVLVYFRREWMEILRGKNPFLLRFLIITTLVSLIVAFPIYKTIRNRIFGGIFLAIMGLGLLVTSFFQRTKRKVRIGRDKLAILTGILQGLAVIPGISRSGATIFGLSLGNFSPQEILRISYMASAPIIFLSSIYLVWKNPNFIFPGWISLVFSFLTGIITLHCLIGWVKRVNFSYFTFIFGLLCLVGAIFEFLF